MRPPGWCVWRDDTLSPYSTPTPGIISVKNFDCAALFAGDSVRNISAEERGTEDPQHQSWPELDTTFIYTSYLHRLFTLVIYTMFLHWLFTQVIVTVYLQK